MTASPRVLVVAKSAATCERWCAWLDSECEVFTDVEAQAAQGQIEVLLSDAQLTDDLAGLRDHEMGVVLVGCDGACDVALDEDTTERELRLACRLLAKIVRLKRESAAGHRERQKLHGLATTDPLTSLPNRRAWDEEACNRTEDAGGCCLVVVDLDHFKVINDEQGHDTGDAVLQQAASAIKSSLRPGDFVARLGGDEFGVLISGIDGEIAARLVERLRKSIESRALALGQSWTASAGFSISSGPVQLCDLFAAADAALRAAKASGRDCARRGEIPRS